jgi:hypothetical protein
MDNKIMRTALYQKFTYIGDDLKGLKTGDEVSLVSINLITNKTLIKKYFGELNKNVEYSVSINDVIPYTVKSFMNIHFLNEDVDYKEVKITIEEDKIKLSSALMTLLDVESLGKVMLGIDGNQLVIGKYHPMYGGCTVKEGYIPIKGIHTVLEKEHYNIRDLKAQGTNVPYVVFAAEVTLKTYKYVLNNMDFSNPFQPDSNTDSI